MANTDIFLKQVGSKIKAARKAQRISQDKLCERLPINGNALSKIETGQVNMHLCSLKAIADALGVDIKDFL